jgi:hypothetical protein
MTNVERRDLGSAGRAYIRDHLINTNVFCSGLLQTINSEPGECFTIAPPCTSEARLVLFEEGGLLPENLLGQGTISLQDGGSIVPVASLVEQQVKLLKGTVIASAGSVCVVDDFNPRWSERTPHIEPTAFGVGEEVYHLLTKDHRDEEFKIAVSNSNLIWHGVSAVCRAPIALGVVRETTEEVLLRSAASALLVTCTAFDGEGFVAWRRTSV